jgi:hypothetical protein
VYLKRAFVNRNVQYSGPVEKIHPAAEAESTEKNHKNNSARITDDYSEI